MIDAIKAFEKKANLRNPKTGEVYPQYKSFVKEEVAREKEDVKHEMEALKAKEEELKAREKALVEKEKEFAKEDKSKK
jgi:hypothetical protein